MIPWVDVSGEWKGINIDGGLWINESYVATERDIDKLNLTIAEMEGEIKILTDRLDKMT